MKMKKLLSMLLVIALVVTTASFTPSKVVEAKAKKKYVKSLKVAKSVTITKGQSKTIKVKIKVKGKASKKFSAYIKNSNVASASKKGKKIVIKAKKAGSTKIAIVSKGKGKKGKKLKKYITVKVVNGKKKSNGSNSGQIPARKNAVLSELLINEPDIDVGVEKEVIFTGDIENSDEETYDVVEADGDIVGQIYDDGYGKDEIEGDGVFTGEIALSSNVEKEEKYYVIIDNKKSQEYAIAYFYRPITNEEADEANIIQKGIDDIDKQYDGETEESAQRVFGLVTDYIKEQKEKGFVKSYSVDDTSIAIELYSGIPLVYNYPVPVDAKGSDSLRVSNSKSLVTSGMSNPSRSSVATFEPFANSITSGGFDAAARRLRDSVYSYNYDDNYDNGQVTVERAKNLDDYSVILWCGHGGYNSKYHSFVGLGVSGINPINIIKYWQDIKAHRLVIEGNGRLWMTSKFVERYYNKKSFKNTLIYMGICEGARDNVLGNTFINKGAAVYLGYKKTVQVSYDDRMVQQLIGQMVENDKTAGRALELCKGWYGDPSQMQLIGENNYKISANNTVNNADKYDIVLTWGADPCDMDSHIEGYTSTGDFFHVYYANDEAYDNGNLICQLDDDDTSSYGPETITIKTTSAKAYYYYVHRYEGDGSVNTSKSVVKVYKNGVLKHTYNVGENNGYGDYWNVFAIKNGKFVERNTITDDPDTSY